MNPNLRWWTRMDRNEASNEAQPTLMILIDPKDP